jgi:hypothetical protein
MMEGCGSGGDIEREQWLEVLVEGHDAATRGLYCNVTSIMCEEELCQGL